MVCLFLFRYELFDIQLFLSYVNRGKRRRSSFQWLTSLTQHVGDGGCRPEIAIAPDCVLDEQPPPHGEPAAFEASLKAADFGVWPLPSMITWS